MSRTNRLRLESLETRVVPATELYYTRSLIGLPADSITKVVANPVGEVYVAGTFSGTIDLDPFAAAAKVTARGGTDAFIAKYDATGHLLWGATLDGLADESVARIALDGLGNVYVAGTFSGAVDFNPDPNAAAVASGASGGSAFVWKLDYQGNFVMARTVNGTSAVTGMAVDSAGNIVVGGTFKGAADFNPDPNVTADLTTSNTDGAAFVWKLDQTGALVWADSIQTSGTIVPTAVAVNGNGAAYLAGSFTGTADLDPSDGGRAYVAAGSNSTPFIVKLASDGSYLWGQTIRTVTAVSGAPNTIAGVAIDGIGNVYAAGTFAGTLDFDPGAGTSKLYSTGSSVDGFAWKLDAGGGLVYAPGLAATRTKR